MISKKAKKIEQMFSEIAPKYDLLNSLLSAGIDSSWRKACIAKLTPDNGIFLDIATGTGDLAIELRKQNKNAKIIAIDFSQKMLKIGKTKMSGHKISIQRGDALALAYRESTLDGITCAFGIRNFENLESGLKEMLKVLKPGGRVAILEFATPCNRIIKSLYLFYFIYILPVIGSLISGHKEAYSYLAKSAINFPDRKKLSKIFSDTGFCEVEITPLTFGICDLIYAKKPTA